MRLISVEEFKKDHKILIDEWSNLSKDELLEFAVKQTVVALNMETRVFLFMNECTNEHKSNYSLEKIKELIKDKK